MDAKQLAALRLQNAMKKLADSYRQAASEPGFADHVKELNEFADEWDLHIAALDPVKK